MNCPKCNTTLSLSERQGVEIDVCPGCRGVWLDRGELDKILDRAVSETSPAAPAPAPPRYDEPRGYQQPQQGYQSGGYQQGYKKKRKEHWLSELFD